MWINLQICLEAPTVHYPEDQNVHNECKPGPEILKIKRDVIGEIQQYEWPKNPQSSIGDVLRAMWGVNLAQICFGAPLVHYPCTKKVKVLAPMDSKGYLAMWESGPEILKK